MEKKHLRQDNDDLKDQKFQLYKYILFRRSEHKKRENVLETIIESYDFKENINQKKKVKLEKRSLRVQNAAHLKANFLRERLKIEIRRTKGNSLTINFLRNYNNTKQNSTTQIAKRIRPGLNSYSQRKFFKVFKKLIFKVKHFEMACHGILS